MLVFEFPLHKTSIRGTLAILAIRDLFKLYRGRGKRQVNRPAEQPWFDQPNVMKLLEQRRRGREICVQGIRASAALAPLSGHTVCATPSAGVDVLGMLRNLDN